VKDDMNSREDTYQWNRTISEPIGHVSNRFKIRKTWKHVLVERYRLWTSM